MKNRFLILIYSVLIAFLISSYSWAAPNINVNGVMNDWSGSGGSAYYPDTNEWTDGAKEYFKSSESGQSGKWFYDVEMVGLYVSDTELFIGVHSDFPLIGSYDGQKAGDYVLDFGSDGTVEAAFSFIQDGTGQNNLDLELKLASTWNYTTGSPVGNPNGSGSNFEYSVASASQTIVFENVGTYIPDDQNVSDDSYTLEASIDRELITGALGDLLKNNTELSAYWSMQCGNDWIKVSDTYSNNPNTPPIPEPATFMLFGMGLLGVSAFGRKTQKKDNA